VMVSTGAGGDALGAPLVAYAKTSLLPVIETSTTGVVPAAIEAA